MVLVVAMGVNLPIRVKLTLSFPFTFLLCKVTVLAYAAVDFDTYSYGMYKLEDEMYGIKNNQLTGKIQYRNPTHQKIVNYTNLPPNEVETQILKTIRKRLATGVLVLTEILTNVAEKTLFRAYILKDTQLLVILIPGNDKILPGKNLICNEAPTLFESSLKPCPKFDILSQTIHEDTLIKFEDYLFNFKPKCAIHFIVLSPETYYIYTESLKTVNLLQSRLIIGAKSKIIEPEEVNKFKGANVYGFVEGDPEIPDRGLIAFVTHYDTYSLVQRYPSSSKTTNSGIIALLELAKTISLMYKVKPGKYDALFLLTANSINDFSGADAFLISHERTSKRLNLVICLDTISSDDLFFHTSKIHKSHEFSQFIRGLERYSKMMNAKFRIVTSKIKFYDNNNNFQHEVFSRKKIVSGTVSNLETPERLLNRSKIFDIKIDIKQLKSNIDIILKSFIDITYQLEPLNNPQISDYQTQESDVQNLDMTEANTIDLETIKPDTDENTFNVDVMVRKYCANTSYYSILALNSWISKTPRTFGNRKLVNKYFIPEVMDYLSKFIDSPKINNFKTRESNITVYLENDYKAIYYFGKHLLFDFAMLIFTIIYLFIITAFTIGSFSDTIQLITNYVLQYGKGGSRNSKRKGVKSKG